ncbi:MAG: DUF2155 domain-containing protein [Hyphomicrobiaceae bacterium]
MTSAINTAKGLAALSVLLGVSVAGYAPSASAQQRISNQVAVFAALDKVTATIKKLEVPLGETQEFGSLKITPRVCFSRAATEKPKTSSFVEVEETLLEGEQKRIFTGWMFAESPGLNAVEHPVFDVWLTGCEKPDNPEAAAAVPDLPEGGTPQAVQARPPSAEPPRRRRVRR